jgi:hypothetical protein
MALSLALIIPLHHAAAPLPPSVGDCSVYTVKKCARVDAHCHSSFFNVKAHPLQAVKFNLSCRAAAQDPGDAAGVTLRVWRAVAAAHSRTLRP